MASVLRRVRLHGFKTFAQRTEIGLEGDLIAVIGPNGCGKSNLVDALVWALGETSIRALRASNPTEVIFSGSSTQKPLGLAEVSLWFDNEMRWLPLDADEVQITRRLYRSGEWECWINKTPCRLKDVADLFAGTGLGRGGYAIIGQGEIESFLNAAAEERRLWIEEAAGIALYRHRRRETLRDLDSARIHLQRVQDVLNELERQREPLREQAELARRYRALREELRTLERTWLLYELRTTIQRLDTLNSEREATRAKLLNLESQIAQVEREAETRGEKVASLETEMDTLRGVQSGLLSALERLEGRLNVLLERHRTLLELKQVTEDELGELQNRIQQVQEAKTHLRARMQTAKAALQQVERRCEALQQESHQLEAQLERLEHAWQEAMTAHLHRQELEARLQGQQTLFQQTEGELQELTDALQSRQDALDAIREHLLAQSVRLRSIEQELGTLEAELHQAQEDHRYALEEVSALTARLNATRASLSAGEGAAPGTRNLLRALQQGELQGDYQTVAQVLRVPPSLQLAVEAALGGSLHDVITPTEAEARRAIEWLKQKSAGRVTFLPLDLLERRGRGAGEGENGRRGEGEREKPRPPVPASLRPVGIASELVEYDPKYRPAIEWLLNRVLVVETLEAAVQLLREWRKRGGGREPFNRLVTLDGEIVQTSGVMTGGRLPKERSSALALKVECDQLEETLQQKQTVLRSLAARCNELEGQRQRLLTQRQEAEQPLEQLRQQEAQAYNAWRDLQNQVQMVQSHLQNIAEEIQNLQTELEKGLQGETHAEAVETLREQVEARRKSHLDLLNELARWKVERQRLAQEQEEVQARLQQEEHSLQQTQTLLQPRRTRLQNIEDECAQIITNQANLQKERETLQVQLQQAESNLQAMREEKQRELEAGFQLADQLKKQRAEQTAYAKQERDLELQIARLEVHRTELSERWQAEFGEEGVGEGENEGMGEDKKPETRNSKPEFQARLQQLRRELQAMGEVNTGAVEAYEQLSERYEALATQRDDLLQTRTRLENALREMDRHARQQFEETFEAIRGAFRTRFERLFGGGRADLILTDPQDPLSSGILIEAQPPGKRRQRLELLSGGERALTAAALLFAFLEVRPSPLCVLDEVDAALDGANVERFVEHLRELASSSQTLVVTHNPATIASADNLIGITMPEPGISTVIPYALKAVVQQEVRTTQVQDARTPL